MRISRRRAALAPLLALALLALPAGAAPLPEPTGEPVLTITGNVAEPNDEGDVVFDRDMLRKLGSTTIETTTDFDWQKGKQTFKGVPLEAVLRAAGARGKTVTVTGADEYSVTMPLADLARHDALLATELNGKPLAEDSFGPLWLVFPFDRMTPAERKLYTDKSVWSVVEIEVD